MGIVFPNEAIARRWDGALQARLRRAPLEAFLRARSLVPAPAGVAQDSDNLVRATVLIIDAGLAHHLADHVQGITFPQQASVGHVACVIGRALAGLVSNPTTWRIVALVSAARVLTPWIGLNAAAIASASSARQFQRNFSLGPSPTDRRIIEGACAAINRDDAQAMAEVCASIAAHLNSVDSPQGNCAASEFSELNVGS